MQSNTGWHHLRDSIESSMNRSGQAITSASNSLALSETDPPPRQSNQQRRRFNSPRARPLAEFGGKERLTVNSAVAYTLLSMARFQSLLAARPATRFRLT